MSGDDAIASLSGFSRYSSSKQTGGGPTKPREEEYSTTTQIDGSPFQLSKVHSKPVTGTGIEMERLRTMEQNIQNMISRPSLNNGNSNRDNSEEREDTSNNESPGDADRIPSAGTSTNYEVDASLFHSKKAVALTKAPSALNPGRVATPPVRMRSALKPQTIGIAKDSAKDQSVEGISGSAGRPISRSRTRPNSSKLSPRSGGRKVSADKSNINKNLLPPSYDTPVQENKGNSIEIEEDSPGVIWVRSFTNDQGSVFVGKPMLDDDGSMDSQELYAMQQTIKAGEETAEAEEEENSLKATESNRSVADKNIPMTNALTNSVFKMFGKNILLTGTSRPGTADASVFTEGTGLENGDASVWTERTPENGDASVWTEATGSSGSEGATMYSNDASTAFTKGEGTKGFTANYSIDTESEDEMDEYGNFTVQGEYEYGMDDDDDNDDGDSDSGGSEDTNDEDDETMKTAYTKGNDFDISTVLGNQNVPGKSLKTTLSDVSGSFDDDAKTSKMVTIVEEVEQDPHDMDGKKKKARDLAEKKKNRKKVFKMATGIGKKKTVGKTVKTLPVISPKTKGRPVTSKKKITKMKSTGIRAPKKKSVTKKRGVQLRSIRINDEQDDILPRKGDPGVNVMRVCKLTSHGYVAAEFTSVDPFNTPLHIACLTHYPTKFILDHLLKTDNEFSVGAENSSGELPLHYAVMDKKGVDPNIFEALIEHYPEAVEHKNIDDSLPLHVACQVGAPSLYSIKRLLELKPESALEQNDLQVPLEDEDGADDEEQAQTSGCGPMVCLDWFHKEDEQKYIRYETGWTPLHLAAVNGAPPEVIEAIIEANLDCISMETNKGRTPMECSKWVIINAIINDIPVYKVQNTFNAIEVMQSYEKEIRVKEELALKSGIVNSSLENQDSYGEWWMKGTELLPARDKIDDVLKKERESTFDDHGDYGDDLWGDEKGMTNLHRAVLKKADADKIHKLLEASPECMDIVSTADRTPFECAKMLLIRGLLNKDPINTISNTFVTLEVMQAYRQEHNQDIDQDFTATAALSRANVNSLKTMDRKNWGSTADTYEYMKLFANVNLSGQSLLGKMVTADNDSAVQPYEYFPPPNLRHVNLRINVPVGYRRLRKALLNQRSEFLMLAVYNEGLKYRKMKAVPWNKHSKSIGNARLKKGEKWKDFIGATKTLQYMVPKSEVGGGHMAYESIELVEYNDFCFAFKSIIKTPDLPFGSEYETHCQVIVIDKGINNTRMICSSEMIVTGMSMEDDWQVRNSMRHRTTDYFHAIADAVCIHAGSAHKRK